MDSRLTLNTTETFLGNLESAFRAKTKVNLLIDEGGITRKEGLIASLQTSPNAIIEMQDGSKIILEKIVAVNGVFRPEYGEC